MTGELIATGVTFGTGRKALNDAFSGTAEFNIIESYSLSATNIYTGGHLSANTASIGTPFNTSGFDFDVLGRMIAIGSGAHTFEVNTLTTDINVVQIIAPDVLSGVSNTFGAHFSTDDNSSVNRTFAKVSAYVESRQAGSVTGGIAFGTAINGTMASSPTTKMTIDSNGDVEILSGNLSAGTGGAIYSAGTDLYNIFATTGSDTNIGNTNQTLTDVRNVDLSTYDLSFTPTGGYNLFYLDNDGGGSGNVGIGTSSPSGKLDVRGGLSATTVSAATINTTTLRGFYDPNVGGYNDINIPDSVYMGAFANLSAGTGGGAIYSAGTDLYNIFAAPFTLSAGTNVTLNTVGSTTTINGGGAFYDLGTTSGNVDWSILSTSRNGLISLAGNVTALNLIGVTDGDEGRLRVRQTTGGHTLVLGAGTHRVSDGGGGVVTLSTGASAIDTISYYYEGSAFYWTVDNNFT